MRLLREEKEKIVKKFSSSEKDTGKSEVQIALFTHKIGKLTEHFKSNKKDYHSMKGLFSMVNRRKKLLAYLKRTSPKRFQDIAKSLKLRV